MLQIFHILFFFFFFDEHIKIANFEPQSREVHISCKGFIAYCELKFSYRPWRPETCLGLVVLLSVCVVFVACRYEEAVNLILESFNDDCIYSQIHKILTFKPILKRPP